MKRSLYQTDRIGWTRVSGSVREWAGFTDQTPTRVPRLWEHLTDAELGVVPSITYHQPNLLGRWKPQTVRELFARMGTLSPVRVPFPLPKHREPPEQVPNDPRADAYFDDRVPYCYQDPDTGREHWLMRYAVPVRGTNTYHPPLFVLRTLAKQARKNRPKRPRTAPEQTSDTGDRPNDYRTRQDRFNDSLRVWHPNNPRTLTLGGDDRVPVGSDTMDNLPVFVREGSARCAVWVLSCGAGKRLHKRFMNTNNLEYSGSVREATTNVYQTAIAHLTEAFRDGSISVRVRGQDRTVWVLETYQITNLTWTDLVRWAVAKARLDYGRYELGRPPTKYLTKKRAGSFLTKAERESGVYNDDRGYRPTLTDPDYVPVRVGIRSADRYGRDDMKGSVLYYQTWTEQAPTTLTDPARIAERRERIANVQRQWFRLSDAERLAIVRAYRGDSWGLSGGQTANLRRKMA